MILLTTVRVNDLLRTAVARDQAAQVRPGRGDIDNSLDNGFVHEIDGVLVPPSE
ncbi:MAG: hypothetical protein AAF267_25120 [Deinococcota bacterium]